MSSFGYLVPDSADGLGHSVCSHSSLPACCLTPEPTYILLPVRSLSWSSRVDRISHHMGTYVAPTCRSCRKAGVNWYRTKRPALGSHCFLPPAEDKMNKNNKKQSAFWVPALARLIRAMHICVQVFLLNWWTNKPFDILEGFWTRHIMCYLVSARWSSPGIGGLVISKRTVPVSMSRILNLVKSIMWTFSSGEQR